MTLTMPVPFLPLPGDFAKDFPTEAQALLNNGSVLAFELEATAHNYGTAGYAGVRVYIPDPQAEDGFRLVSDYTDIVARESAIPGLIVACLALNQHYYRTLHPGTFFEAWKGHEPDNDDGTTYMTITLLKDGFTVGETDPHSGMESDFDELYAAIEDEDEDHEFPTGRLVAITMPVPDTSAHARLALLGRAERTLKQWLRIHPLYAFGRGDIPALPLLPPATVAITTD